MVFVLSLVLLVFCDLLCLIVTGLCLVHSYATLIVVSYHCWFFMFFLVFCLFLSSMFESREFVGKEEINGVQEELDETQQVMQGLDEDGACVREAKGKSMTIG